MGGGGGRHTFIWAARAAATAADGPTICSSVAIPWLLVSCELYITATHDKASAAPPATTATALLLLGFASGLIGRLQRERGLQEVLGKERGGSGSDGRREACSRKLPHAHARAERNSSIHQRDVERDALRFNTRPPSLASIDD